MSYVAITGKLLNEVGNKIAGLKRIELSGETEPEKPVLTGKEDWLRPLLWGPLYGTEFEGHPALTCTVTHIVQFTVNGHGHDEAEEYIGTAATINLLCEIVPRHMRCTSSGNRHEAEVIECDISVLPYFGALKAHNEATKEIIQRWYKVRDDITEFLKTCKSLNDALKLWPDLRRYVPAEALAKVDEKTEKAPKKSNSEAIARLAAMDLEAITTSTVLARMVGAANATQGD